MHNLKERVEVQELYSVKDCLNNPHKLYIFGDNLIGVGKGGQAIIRDCPNTYGIPTKALPSMYSNSFFSDKDSEIEAVKLCLQWLRGYYKDGMGMGMWMGSDDPPASVLPILVFPEKGLGTGLSQMPTRSPKLYKLMNDLVYKYFGVKYE